MSVYSDLKFAKDEDEREFLRELAKIEAKKEDEHPEPPPDRYCGTCRHYCADMCSNPDCFDCGEYMDYWDTCDCWEEEEE